MPDNLTALENDNSAYGFLRSLASIFLEVVFFWQIRLYAWWKRKPKQEVVINDINAAETYEQWEDAAFKLDELRGNDLWRQNPSSKFYDYRLIYERLQALIEAREEDDILGLVNLMRSGLVRNLGNITAASLFNRAFAGTKLLIEDYVTQVALAVSHVAGYPTSLSTETGLTSQAKLDVLHDTRQAFGRSALLLQGGAIFGLCHIGVVKALHLRGLLPRIIAGSSTGALVAALVGVHTEDELLEFLTGDGIDLSAFDSNAAAVEQQNKGGFFQTMYRRVSRFVRHGYLLDVRILEECVRANVGDMTFEEAYARTKRVLNITILTSTSSGESGPGLLNYITAPNVHKLIWSAAAAANADSGLYSPVTLLCKTSSGAITPWSSRPIPSSTGLSTPTNALKPARTQPETRDTPTSRIAELFNVNHFIVSQARPSIAPFLTPASAAVPRSTTATARRRTRLWTPLRRVIVLELQHRLAQLAALGALPAPLARFLLDEPLPGESLTLVPALRADDFGTLLERPTPASLEGWIRRGERSVWPAVSALRARCAIEFELDRAYQAVRRRKPMDVVPRVVGEERGLKGTGERRRKRAKSLSEQEGGFGNGNGNGVAGARLGLDSHDV